MQIKLTETKYTYTAIVSLVTILACIHVKATNFKIERTKTTEISNSEYLQNNQESNKIKSAVGDQTTFVAIKSGKWGFLDSNGYEISPFIFDSIAFLNKNAAAIRVKNKWGVFDLASRKMTPCIYKRVYSSSPNDLICVELNKKWGFYDFERKKVTTLKYDEIGNADYGIIPVKEDGKWGFLNMSYTNIIACKYETAGNILDENVITVNIKGIWNIIDTNNHVLTQSIPTEIYRLTKGIYYFKNNDESIHLINKYGIPLLDKKYNDISLFQDDLYIVKRNGLFGLLNKGFNEIIPCQFEDYEFSGNRIAFLKNEKWAFFTPTGQQLTPFDFDEINISGEAGYFRSTFDSEGMGIVKKDEKWGLIDTNGSIILPIKFESIAEFSEGLVAVSDNSLWGFYDKKGNIKIPCIYENVGKFSEGLSPISINGKWGYINKENRIIIPCIYDYADTFRDGLAQINVKENIYIIDQKGEQLFPQNGIEVLIHFSKTLLLAQKENKYGIISHKGQILAPIKYDAIYLYEENLLEPGC
ncbi:MAG: WG repeat-containing protein [Bacteroidota bacterium]